MSDDLIRRSDAIDALNECEDIKGYAYTQMHDAIMEIPSVDIPHSDDWEKYSDKLWQKAYERGKADRPQGEWLKDDEGTFICSACGSGYKDQPTIMGKPLFEWCPICGCRMKGADDESLH